MPTNQAAALVAINARNTARLQTARLLLREIARVNSAGTPVNTAATAALEPIDAELARRSRHSL